MNDLYENQLDLNRRVCKCPASLHASALASLPENLLANTPVYLPACPPVSTPAFLQAILQMFLQSVLVQVHRRDLLIEWHVWANRRSNSNVGIR